MNKRIKLKLEKKNNTNKINSILKEINYTIEKKVFGNGYFVFTFEKNSICWFWLKEFKGWKFGIWLNADNTYDIFGEHILLINKFKPSASYVSFDNVNDFNENLKLFLDKNEIHSEYIQWIEEAIENEKIKTSYLFNLTNDIYDYIKYFNTLNKNNYCLEFKDYGGCRSPRYEFKISYYNTYDLTQEDEYKIYLELSKVREKSYNKENEENWLGETFLVCFKYINNDLLTEEEFNLRKIKYKWTSEKTKDFESFVNN